MGGTNDEDSTTLSAQEKAALRERTRERKAAKKGAEAEQAVLEAIAALSELSVRCLSGSTS